MKDKFSEIAFREDSLKTIELVNQIVAEYERQGYKLSLRQLYYQLVSRDYIENSQPSYKRLGDLVSNARLAGLVDWDMIEDRGREAVIVTTWGSPGQIIRAAASQYRTDKWRNQFCYVEVMVEKAALEGVLLPVCRELEIMFTANKGYSSSSAMYEAGQRLIEKVVHGKEVHILYLGDHDPSGIDMTRDIRDRLGLFARTEIGVNRLALNMDQVEQYDPPENPAKTTDSRYAAYIDQFGESSWELDALAPEVLAALVRDTVLSLRDEEQWAADLEEQETAKEKLIKFAQNYE